MVSRRKITALWLPLIYDLVALARPATVVTLGFREGDVHFAFCEAAREMKTGTYCLALPRDFAAEEIDDESWLRGRENGREIYGAANEFVSDSWSTYASQLAPGSIDILFIDEVDSGADLADVLASYEPTMSPNGLVIFHGTKLERADSPGAAWEKWMANKHTVRFSEGIGLGIASVRPQNEPLDSRFDYLFPQARATELAVLYRLAAARIEAQHRATVAARQVASLTARQVWLDSILDDRREAQRILEEQARTLADLRPRVEAWQRDRESLQRDRANWVALAQRYEAERNKYKQLAKEQKELIKMARSNCRKKGRCFQLPQDEEEKKQRPISERILREIKRVPSNLFGRKPERRAAKPAARKKKTDEETWSDPLTRYAAWMEAHEPDAHALEAQRRQSLDWPNAPKISLLLPVFNPPAQFLEAMLASVRAQTFANWELCLVDAGSSDDATRAVLEKWENGSDSRVKFVRLPANFGIAQNTNRALEMATGDFFACIDHDDLLAPFAVHAIACAIGKFPEADMIYSDEDRCDVAGNRHAPFFKPEWSPELLVSFMYVGHLTAYRRALGVALGGFRKEFDLSQDYDFALRASERSREIRHIAQVLYHWREHPASASTGGKPDARKSNLAALGEAMQRRNLHAEIVGYPTANRARFVAARWPRVSIIVSTDSPERAQVCAFDLHRRTEYPDFEIVLVTNSQLAEKLTAENSEPNEWLRIVCYDNPFNFSDKCNAGAAVATGERLIFFNDDVQPTEPNWIQELTEQLENPEVGAVAPKLIYESGKIQHAGLVTGVRGLVGTACHQWPADSADYSNFAQSLRDVSALSGACLALRRDDFFRLGEFDAIHAPIAHSDLDLCFKVREAGLRCVYTPFVTMVHLGHASIGAIEPEKEAASTDKASVFLLQRWAGYSCHDPYFPANIRDWLYRDSPTPIRMWGENEKSISRTELDLLLVTHDLSWSGAPLILLHVATWCRAHGFFVTLMSPEDGPLREEFTRAGVPVIVDPLVNKGHVSFTDFAREFDCVVASTIFGAPVILAAQAAGIPHLWWIHEGQVAESYITEDRAKQSALRLANLIVTPDKRSEEIYRIFTDKNIKVLNYGIPDPRLTISPPAPRGDRKVRFLLLGTIEQRKGQRVFLEALRKLPTEVRERADFQIIGRRHDATIAREIEEAAIEYGELAYRESVTHDEALALINDCDVMVSASWDETGPLILMEGLALGKPILSTSVGAVAEHLAGERSGIFFAPGDAAALARGIEDLVREPELVDELREESRLAYEHYFTFDRFAEGFAKLVREAAKLPASAAEK